MPKPKIKLAAGLEEYFETGSRIPAKTKTEIPPEPKKVEASDHTRVIRALDYLINTMKITRVSLAECAGLSEYEITCMRDESRILEESALEVFVKSINLEREEFLSLGNKPSLSDEKLKSIKNKIIAQAKIGKLKTYNRTPYSGEDDG